MGRIRIIGVPLDLGASRRGVDMGPSALRIAQLERRLEELGHVVEDYGNLFVPEREALPGVTSALDLLPAITQVCGELARHTAQAIRDGAMPLVLGGDHTVGQQLGGLLSHRPGNGSVLQVARAHGRQSRSSDAPSALPPRHRHTRWPP